MGGWGCWRISRLHSTNSHRNPKDMGQDIGVLMDHRPSDDAHRTRRTLLEGDLLHVFVPAGKKYEASQRNTWSFYHINHILPYINHGLPYINHGLPYINH